MKKDETEKAETERVETEEIETEKVKVKKVEMRRKRRVKFFAIYTGQQRHISLSGVGRIFPGKPFEVDEHVANTLRQSADFMVKEKTVYIEV